VVINTTGKFGQMILLRSMMAFSFKIKIKKKRHSVKLVNSQLKSKEDTNILNRKNIKLKLFYENNKKY